MNRPMTTAELFGQINELLKEKELIPEILDYALAAYHPVPIKTYEFDLKSNLGYGGSEGHRAIGYRSFFEVWKKIL